MENILSHRRQSTTETLCEISYNLFNTNTRWSLLFKYCTFKNEDDDDDNGDDDDDEDGDGDDEDDEDEDDNDDDDA